MPASRAPWERAPVPWWAWARRSTASITAVAAGPGFGESIGVGAGIGAGTVLIYDLLKHEKHIILVQGTTMTFVISRSVDASTGKPLEPDNPI